MSRKEITTLRRAAVLAGVSAETIREWCEKFSIGRFEAGKWHIDRPSLMRIVRARKALGK